MAPLAQPLEGLQVLSDRLIELARVQPGDTVLDVGTGTGEPATTIARKVGPGGRVVAIDISSEMIGVAERRAAELGLENIEFKVMGAEKMALGSQKFNAVLSRLVLMFLPDPAQALSKFHDLLVPGGRLAVAVLGPIAKTPLVETWARVLAPDRIPSDGAGAFKFSDPDVLAQMLRDAGFNHVEVETRETISTFKSLEKYLELASGMSAEVNRLLTKCIPAQRDGFLRDIEVSLSNFRKPDGTIELVSEPHLAAGRAGLS